MRNPEQNGTIDFLNAPDCDDIPSLLDTGYVSLSCHFFTHWMNGLKLIVPSPVTGSHPGAAG